MTKVTLLTSTIAATALSLASFTAVAGVSSTSEFRGYQACLASADQESRGLVPARAYYIAKDGANAEYFINATRWEAGERATVRINCQTTARGQQLVGASIESGSFTNDANPSVRVEVAQN